MTKRPLWRSPAASEEPVRTFLVALDVDDIARRPNGIVISVRRSKTDQAGAGCTKAIPQGRKLHAVGALDA